MSRNRTTEEAESRWPGDDAGWPHGYHALERLFFPHSQEDDDKASEWRRGGHYRWKALNEKVGIQTIIGLLDRMAHDHDGAWDRVVAARKWRDRQPKPRPIVRDLWWEWTMDVIRANPQKED